MLSAWSPSSSSAFAARSDSSARDLLGDVAPAVVASHSGTASRAISAAMRRSRERSRAMCSALTTKGDTSTS